MNTARLIVSCAVLSFVAAVPASASAAQIYFQDFQGIANNTANPDGWDGISQAASLAGASTEGVSNDRALIGTSAVSFTTKRDLGVAVQPNTTYTLDLDGGLWSSPIGRSSELRWELGTINGGVFTSFSTFNSTTLTNSFVSEFNFDLGNEVALAQYSFTTGGAVSGDNVAISLHVEELVAAFGGFDSIDVNAAAPASFIPEPSSVALAVFCVLAFVVPARSRRRG